MTAKRRIYLDWNATAPLDAAAQQVLANAGSFWSNPSSIHADGRAARGHLEAARESIASDLGCAPAQVIFTSGGTEALALALRGSGAARWLISGVEHSAVTATVPGAEIVGVDAAGVIDLEDLDRRLGEGGAGALVAVMHANNETGVIQPLETVAEIVSAHGARLLADAVQTAGKLPFPVADFACISAHKFGGLAGVGALVARCMDGLEAVQKGGGQERGLRGGTENLPGIMAMAAALSARLADTGWNDRAGRLRNAMEARLQNVGAEIIAAGALRLGTTSLIRMPGVPAAAQLIEFDLAGISVSSGSACSSGKVGESHVLRAMGVDARAGAEAIRVSLGWDTGQRDIDAFCAVWETLAARRSAAA